MRGEAIETAVATAASKSTYAGAGSVLIGWFLSSEFAVLVGIVVAIAGFAVNWYFRAKADKREQLEHEARMRKMKTKPGDLQ